MAVGVSIGAVVERLNVSRAKLQRAVVIGDGTGVVGLVVLGVAAIIEGGFVVAVERERLAVILQGAVVFAFGEEGNAAIIVGRGYLASVVTA